MNMKLKDCCAIIAGQSPESSSYNMDGIGLPFFQGKTEFGELYPTIKNYCSQPKKIAEKDDILLSVRAPIGPTNLSPTRVCIGRGLSAIRPDASILSIKYLLHFFRYIEKTLSEKGTGTTFKAITQDVVKNIEVPVIPLKEQKRIVNKIEELFSELDSAVETLKKTKEQLAVYRQAVLKEAFDACDKKEKITSYFEISAGLTKNSKRASFPLKMPYLRVANVYYNRLNLSEIKSIGVQESEIDDKLLKKEDLLFVEGNGSKEQIGRVAIWDDSIKNCLHQNHIIKGRPLGGMLSKFALYYLISDFGRKQILKVSSSTSGLYTLSTEKVRNLNVPSCSLLKQKNIVQQIESRLSACENIERTVNEALIQADAMRQSIFKKAFEGSL